MYAMYTWPPDTLRSRCGRYETILTRASSFMFWQCTTTPVYAVHVRLRNSWNMRCSSEAAGRAAADRAGGAAGAVPWLSLVHPAEPSRLQSEPAHAAATSGLALACGRLCVGQGEGAEGARARWGPRRGFCDGGSELSSLAASVAASASTETSYSSVSKPKRGFTARRARVAASVAGASSDAGRGCFGRRAGGAPLSDAAGASSGRVSRDARTGWLQGPPASGPQGRRGAVAAATVTGAL